MNTHYQERDKKVKIVATVGPATESADDIRELVRNGANLFRLNFSHGEHEEHEERLNWIRGIERELNIPLGVLMDLQGPKLRVGRFTLESTQLIKGQVFTLDLDGTPGDSDHVNLPHPEIIDALEIGMDLLLDDGKLRLRVVSKTDDSIKTTVIVGGELSERKGVNVPQAVLQLSPLTDKDRRDLAFGLSLGVDWVALSFVQRPQDIIAVRKLIRGRASLMAKIEKPSAIEHLDEIIELSDAIMVARGDLGVELPAETVPAIQKRIIQRCRHKGRPVVVATQMLESMRFSPAPTRAEVTDVANAVYEGVDAVMLSAETASGHFPCDAVNMMSRIIRNIEADPNYHPHQDINRPLPNANVQDAISCAIRRISGILDVAVLINFTHSGTTALRAARERPEAPILNLTPMLSTARKLTLAWGIYSAVKPEFARIEEITATALEEAGRLGMARTGDTVVITAGVPFNKPGTTNMMRIETVQ